MQCTILLSPNQNYSYYLCLHPVSLSSFDFPFHFIVTNHQSFLHVTTLILSFCYLICKWFAIFIYFLCFFPLSYFVHLLCTQLVNAAHTYQSLYNISHEIFGLQRIFVIVVCCLLPDVIWQICTRCWSVETKKKWIRWINQFGLVYWSYGSKTQLR